MGDDLSCEGGICGDIFVCGGGDCSVSECGQISARLEQYEVVTHGRLREGSLVCEDEGGFFARRFFHFGEVESHGVVTGDLKLLGG